MAGVFSTGTSKSNDPGASEVDLPGGPQQIAELLDRHAASLELYAAQWTTTPEDCVQEAFLALLNSPASPLQRTGSFRHISQQAPPQNPIAWLYKAVRNQSLNAARAQRRRQHYEKIAAHLTQRKQDSQFDATERLPLAEALDTLPIAERELVVLRVWSELTWQEIADLTETSTSSAQRRYVGALNQLRQYLETPCHPTIKNPPKTNPSKMIFRKN